MDNIVEFLPFIIAALVFLIRLFVKKNQPESTEPTSTTEQPNSFEDLLKQITKQINESKEQQTTTTQTTSKNTQASKNKTTINQEKGLSEADRKKDQHFKPYEVKETKQKKEDKPTLVSKYISESQVKEVFKGEKGMTKEDRKKDQHFNPYQIKKQKQNKFAAILKNKDSFKNAVIVNELLNRKYF